MFSTGSDNLMAAGQMVQKGGQMFSEVVVRMQEQENADTLLRFEAALNDEDRDYRMSLEERKGQLAWGATKDTVKWWADKEKEYLGKLDNDAQRRAFSTRIAKMRDSALDTASKFEKQQRDISFEQSSTAAIISGINRAASKAYLAPKTNRDETAPDLSFGVDADKEDVIKRVGLQAKLNGWTPEIHEQKLLNTLSRFHEEVIGVRADKDPHGAKLYFDKNKAEIEGTKYENIDKMLKFAGVKELAQTTAQTLMDKGFSESSGLAEIRRTLKGEDQEAAVREWKMRWAEKDAIKERDQRSAAESAWRTFYDPKNTSKTIPARLLTRLAPADLRALKHEQEQAISGADTPTDWAKYEEIRNQAKYDPEGFKQRDLRRDYPDLNRTERKELIQLQTKVSKGDNLDAVWNLDKEIKGTLDTLGIDKKELNKIQAAIRNGITAESHRLKRPLTSQEQAAQVAKYFTAGEVIGGGLGGLYDPNRRYYQLTPEEQSAFLPDISKEELNAILEAYKTKARENKWKSDVPTNAQILEIYIQTKARGPAQ
jgi:hypothetical protein